MREVVPSDTLIHWAKLSGFTVRQSKHGGSHVVLQHSQYHDIVCGIVLGSAKLDSQYQFGGALKKVEERQAAKLLRFEEKASKSLDTIYKDLPTHLTATHDYAKGHTVVRDRALPQIGVTIPFEESHLLENKIRNVIEPLKRDTYELLNRARMGYDVSIQGKCGKDKNVLALSHTVYNLPTQYIPPYKAGTDAQDIISKIYKYIQTVEEKDFDHELRLESALKKDFVDTVSVMFHARRGMRTNFVKALNPEGEAITLKFATASNRRACPGDVFGARIAERELWGFEGAMNRLASEHRQARVLEVA